MVRVRFAPSPTGYVHVGSLRTALYCYLFSHHNKGKYVLRIEDTDRSRLVEDAVENLLKEMEWTGIIHDEGPSHVNGQIKDLGDYGPYTQSQRLDIYQGYVRQLVEEDKAYPCFCSRERLDELRASGQHGYDGHCRNLNKEEVDKRIEAGESYVIRMKMPRDVDLVFDDLVRGRISMNSDDSDDQVIQKSDGFPTYHLAVVVDDHLMEISHVIRGEEWLSSVPKHLVLYDYFGWERPFYAHLPNILNSQRKKLSKREGDVSVSDFREKGYLPEALVNFLALVGWNPGDEREIMTMDEMIESFSFERVSRSGGVFDLGKLNYMNNHYIRVADNERLYTLLDQARLVGTEKAHVLEIIDLVKERVDRVPELLDYIEGFYREELVLDDEARASFEDYMLPLLDFFASEIEKIELLDKESVQAAIKATQKEMDVKGKKLYMPLRIGINGSPHGADLVTSILLMGKDLVLKRLSQVGEVL